MWELSFANFRKVGKTLEGKPAGVLAKVLWAGKKAVWTAFAE
jgi:hypothetical protein